MMGVWEWMDHVLATYDADTDFNCSSQCMWSGQLRVTLTNPDNEPSRSMTFFSAGQSDPEGVAWNVLTDFEKWRGESGVEPLSAPEWSYEESVPDA